MIVVHYGGSERHGSKRQKEGNRIRIMVMWLLYRTVIEGAALHATELCIAPYHSRPIFQSMIGSLAPCTYALNNTYQSHGTTDLPILAL